MRIVLFQSIGLAIAKRLATDGASVMISSRKADNVSRAVAELKAAGCANVAGIKCHVGSRDDRHALFTETVKQFGGLDILVSNAAVNPAVGPVLDASEEAWDKIFEINVKAAFLLAKEAKPLLIARGGGSIVFVSSIAGFNPFPVRTKFGQINRFRKQLCVHRFWEHIRLAKQRCSD